MKDLKNGQSDIKLDVLIVGAGFAGLYMLHRARKQGLSAKVLEAASDVGGTWWWNRYPGARCDVESMQYSYSWDEDLQQEWEWSERFATQPEILSYLNHVADRHDLRRDIRFETRVTRVAVIGTGSSGIQVIPEIAKQAGHLTVFQRTPNFSLPARNQPLSREYVRGWKINYPELRRQAREETGSGTIYDFPTTGAMEVSQADREAMYRWRWEKGGPNFMHSFNDLVVREEANRTAADFVRDRIRGMVKDPETADLLCPTDYPIFTKRICVDSQYYETFNRENVELVSLKKHPLEQIESSGIRTTAGLTEVDAIVYATGFDAITGAITSIDIRGRDGATIPEKWKEGPRAYLGLSCHGFPNLFTITGPGSPSVLSNMVVSIEQHVDFIADLLEVMRKEGVVEAEAEKEAENNWVAHVNEVASATLLPKAASWYMGANIPGKPRVFMPYIGVAAYREKCEEIAENGYRGFALRASR